MDLISCFFIFNFTFFNFSKRVLKHLRQTISKAAEAERAA